MRDHCKGVTVSYPLPDALDRLGYVDAANAMKLHLQERWGGTIPPHPRRRSKRRPFMTLFTVKRGPISDSAPIWGAINSRIFRGLLNPRRRASSKSWIRSSQLTLVGSYVGGAVDEEEMTTPVMPGVAGHAADDRLAESRFCSGTSQLKTHHPITMK